MRRDEDMIGEDDCAIHGCFNTVTEPGINDYCWRHAPHGASQLPRANMGDVLRIENAEPHPITVHRPGNKLAAHLMPGEWVKFTTEPVQASPLDPVFFGEIKAPPLGYVWKITERGANRTEAASFLERLHEKVRAKYGEEGTGEEAVEGGRSNPEQGEGHCHSGPRRHE